MDHPAGDRSVRPRGLCDSNALFWSAPEPLPRRWGQQHIALLLIQAGRPHSSPPSSQDETQASARRRVHIHGPPSRAPQVAHPRCGYVLG